MGAGGVTLTRAGRARDRDQPRGARVAVRTREGVWVSGVVAAIVLFAVSLAGCSPDGVGGAPVFPDRRPQFPANGRTLGYVANQMSDTVSVVDLDGMIELGQGPVGLNPVLGLPPG
jgi:hypothetical protein